MSRKAKKKPRPGSVWINSAKLKALIIAEDYSLKEISEECGFCENWLYNVLARGTMCEEGAKKLEELGFRRSRYVIK